MIQFQAKIYKDGDWYSVEFSDLPDCFGGFKAKFRVQLSGEP
jgi:hypothetical protein